MDAAFVAVGSELLGASRLDTNSLRVTALLRRHGVELRRKTVVGDVEADLASEVRALLGRFPLVLISGGLGPTADDVTREAVAEACGQQLRFVPEVVADIEGKFRAIGRRMPEVNRRQAFVVDGATLLANPRGTAPGQRLEHAGTTLFLLPGVPSELDDLLAAEVEPWLAARGGGRASESIVLRVACLPESEVEERIGPLYARYDRERITVLASPGEILVELSATGEADERRQLLEEMAATAEELLGHAVYGRGEGSLEAAVGALLRDRGWTIATGESCTGGLVAERLTRVAGSSDYFLGAVVAYDNSIKELLLDVAGEILRRHGAVSEPVAVALAEGARRRTGAGLGVGVTGVAGPGGGSPDKPVGTVHVAVAGPGQAAAHRRAIFPGDRARVRWQASQLALEMVRRCLLAGEGEGRRVG